MLCRPEVNIGIVCANAPILRPIYLAATGRLPTRSKSGDIMEEPKSGKSHERGFQLNHEPGERKWPSHSTASGKGSQGKPRGPLSSNDTQDIGLPIQSNWRQSLGKPGKGHDFHPDGTETYLSSETGSSVTYMERHVDDRV